MVCRDRSAIGIDPCGPYSVRSDELMPAETKAYTEGFSLHFSSTRRVFIKKFGPPDWWFGCWPTRASNIAFQTET